VFSKTGVLPAPGDFHPALKTSQALAVIKSPVQTGQAAGLMKLYYCQDVLAGSKTKK